MSELWPMAVKRKSLPDSWPLLILCWSATYHRGVQTVGINQKTQSWHQGFSASAFKPSLLWVQLQPSSLQPTKAGKNIIFHTHRYLITVTHYFIGHSLWRWGVSLWSSTETPNTAVITNVYIMWNLSVDFILFYFVLQLYTSYYIILHLSLALSCANPHLWGAPVTAHPVHSAPSPGCSNDEGVSAATLGNEVKQTFSLPCAVHKWRHMNSLWNMRSSPYQAQDVVHCQHKSLHNLLEQHINMYLGEVKSNTNIAYRG